MASAFFSRRATEKALEVLIIHKKRELPSKSAEAPKPIVSTKGATFGGELKEIPVIQTVAKHDDSCCGGTGGSCGCSH